MPTVCRHCQDPARPVNRPRGLCWTCYYTPGVRERVPSTSKFHPGRNGPRGRPVCWACGVTAPAAQRVARFGWASRRTYVEAGKTRPETEVYCPGCFACWGWPPETTYAGRPDDLGRTTQGKRPGKRKSRGLATQPERRPLPTALTGTTRYLGPREYLR